MTKRFMIVIDVGINETCSEEEVYGFLCRRMEDMKESVNVEDNDEFAISNFVVCMD